MAKWVCKNCNGRFDAAKLIECRFCGMSCIEKEKNAEEILEEIEEMFQN